MCFQCNKRKVLHCFSKIERILVFAAQLIETFYSSGTPMHVILSLKPPSPTQPFLVLHYIRCYFQNQSFHISFLICSLVLLLLSSLNESQYDGKVIAGEEAVSKQDRIEPQKANLWTRLKLQFDWVKVNAIFILYNSMGNRILQEICIICTTEKRTTRYDRHLFCACLYIFWNHSLGIKEVQGNWNSSSRRFRVSSEINYSWYRFSGRVDLIYINVNFMNKRKFAKSRPLFELNKYLNFNWFKCLVRIAEKRAVTASGLKPLKLTNAECFICAWLFFINTMFNNIALIHYKSFCFFQLNKLEKFLAQRLVLSMYHHC